MRPSNTRRAQKQKRFVKKIKKKNSKQIMAAFAFKAFGMFFFFQRKTSDSGKWRNAIIAVERLWTMLDHPK